MAKRAKSAGVAIAFLTDHDTVSGFPEARAAAEASGLDLRCGIEINTIHTDNVHILGYGFRWQDAAFTARLGEFRKRRESRVARIVEQLRAAGVALELSDVTAEGHEAMGRPHVADALRRKKIVGSRQEAFSRFLVKGKPGYVESAGPTPEEAIAMIRAAGGFCSLAHPETLADKSLLGPWKELGLEGIEAYYSSHRPAEVARYLKLANDHGFIATGGTDFHGPGTGREKALGVEVPDDVYDRFMERLARCS